MLARASHRLVRAARPLIVIPSMPMPSRSNSSRSAILAPAATELNQRTTKQTPMRGVPIEHVTTATEADSTLTLGDCASTGGNASSFTDVSIGDVLAGKTQYGATLHTVKASESVATSLQLMNHFNIGAILVTAEDDASSIVGIFSTRDFLKHVNDDTKPIDVKNMKVEELMSHDPVFAYADTNALSAMNMMNSGGFRHLPIRDRINNRTIGIVSIGDLVRTMMKDYADRNTFLHDLVNGGYSA